MLKLWTILEKNILPMEAGVYCHHICDYSSDFVYYHHIYCYSSDALMPQVTAWLIHPLVQSVGTPTWQQTGNSSNGPLLPQDIRQATPTNSANYPMAE
jgi:hypothetical protein